MQYRILHDSSAPDLELTVNKWIGLGWTPLGGLGLRHRWRALVRPGYYGRRTKSPRNRPYKSRKRPWTHPRPRTTRATIVSSAVRCAMGRVDVGPGC